jgi:hypothetical protein|tara:strand:- start:51 stop:506 length:456 start_codon:yes stop_codon:yes gene_type:complete
MEIFENLIDEALSKVSGLNIYTFAIYHDHESGFVSVCIDTEENSKLKLEKSNEFSMKYFRDNVRKGDLEQAMLWSANIGRNLSLGDFSAVNISAKEINDISTDNSFYLGMVNAIEKKASKILERSTHGKSLIFCCSTADDEVGLAWAPGSA